MRLYQPLRETGDLSGTTGFTSCHFYLPEELKQAFRATRVRVLELVGLEGLGSHHPREINKLSRNPKRWRTWMEMHYRTCTHPSVVGLSEHMLIVCRKS
jgi:hypothetical protein